MFLNNNMSIEYHLISLHLQSPDVVSIISRYSNVVDCSVKLIFNHQTREYVKSFSIDNNTNEIYMLNRFSRFGGSANIFRVLTPIGSSYKTSRHVQLANPRHQINAFLIYNNEMFVVYYGDVNNSITEIAVYSLKGVFIRTIHLSNNMFTFRNFLIHNGLLFIADIWNYIYIFNMSGQFVSLLHSQISLQETRFFFSSPNNFLFDCNSSLIDSIPLNSMLIYNQKSSSHHLDCQNCDKQPGMIERRTDQDEKTNQGGTGQERKIGGYLHYSKLIKIRSCTDCKSIKNLNSTGSNYKTEVEIGAIAISPLGKIYAAVRSHIKWLQKTEYGRYVLKRVKTNFIPKHLGTPKQNDSIFQMEFLRNGQLIVMSAKGLRIYQ